MKIKHRVLINFFSFCCVFLLLAEAVYGNDIKVKVFDKELKEKNEYMDINLNIPQVNIDSNISFKDKINKSIYDDIKNWKRDLEYLAKNDKEDFQKSNAPWIPFILNTTYNEAYNNKNILSLVIDYYQYTGGAHGLTTRISYNFYLNEEKKLMLKDIFKDNYDYKDFIDNFIKKEIEKSPKEYFNNGKKFTGVKENTDFYISEKELVVYFQLYEIAPYSSGIREFKIPYKLLKDNLKYELK
ncbi:DUF3298 and DUF4163 domain-containing protein [Clostridium tarantellae]|nr:DUF3298 and DUF4163 domain-containing protein [Clostridium tarantellae]